MRYRSDLAIEECTDVYPPKEDTFLLLECLDVAAGQRVLEMGCGTGLISCHIAAAGGALTAADINTHAVECTRKNLDRNRLPGEVIESDLFRNVPDSFDLIVFNPPYLAVEETGTLERAWAGGKEGLDVIDPFIKQVPDHLRPKGSLLILLSSEMDRTGLDSMLSSFSRRQLGSRHYFFEDLWVEELRPL